MAVMIPRANLSALVECLPPAFVKENFNVLKTVVGARGGR